MKRQILQTCKSRAGTQAFFSQRLASSACGGVSLWAASCTGRPRVFAVACGNGYRVEKCAYLPEGGALEWPPF